MRLGSTVSIYVDSNLDVVTHESAQTIKARVVAVDKDNAPDDFILGWKSGQDCPDETTDLDDLDMDSYRKVSNFDDYSFYLLSEDVLLTQDSKETGVKKALKDIKADASDAAWRQAVQRVVAIGHAFAAKQVANKIAPESAKLVTAFLASDEGKHVLAYVLGVALEGLPQNDDPRIDRLAKELRVYGLEVIMGGIMGYAEGFLKDVRKVLPPPPKTAATA